MPCETFRELAARKTIRSSDKLLTKHLDTALEMVRHSHAEAHRSIMMLRPQHLSDGADLPVAIQMALEQSTAGCGLDARFVVRGSATYLPLVTTDTLFRIAQEAIANALRHGSPTALKVILEYAPSKVSLAVIDDGVGFDTKASQGQGFGLAGIRERVRALRGELSVSSDAANGTHIRAVLHLRQNTGTRILIALRERLSAYWKRLRHPLKNRARETPRRPRRFQPHRLHMRTIDPLRQTVIRRNLRPLHPAQCAELPDSLTNQKVPKAPHRTQRSIDRRLRSKAAAAGDVARNQIDSDLFDRHSRTPLLEPTTPPQKARLSVLHRRLTDPSRPVLLHIYVQ
ncbi:MAG: hypothetical protein JST28_22610 [Acidobacteria bacterium]|nr:hypothetical protein [Acidobacteriota bacterium]